MNTNVFAGDSKDAKIGRKWLIGLLEERSIEIVFTKKDGTKREMLSTLCESRIPKSEKSSESAGTRKYSEEAQPVYDIEAKGWRSFRWDSLSMIEFSIGDKSVE